MIYDLWNFPVDEDKDDDWPEDPVPECPVCQAPWGSCMDVIFQKYVEGPDND